jgi:Zn-finger nucleic acid-binding protein
VKCLNCGTEMTNNLVLTANAHISYDMCEKCGSLWLDAGELDKMAFQVEGSIEYCEHEIDGESETKPKKCPCCDNSDLEKVRFLESDDIFLHYCRNCGGFWLDGGELNLIDQELAKIMPVRGTGFSDFVNNVHVPYWFKRVKKPSSQTDFHREIPPIAGAKLENDTMDICPACGNMLNQYTVFSMEFEGCPKCKGIWVVKDELRRLKNREDSSLRWLNEEIENIEKAGAIATKRACVKCKSTQLIAVVFGKSSIIVDWCPQCHGLWLDRGEFEAITAYLKDELVKMHSEEIEKQAAEDAKRVLRGGPESRFQDILDTKAALSALINTTIFEHPALFRFCASIPRF